MFKWISQFRKKDCECSIKQSGFFITCKTTLDGKVSCCIDDDEHEQVIELTNTRGYQVVYDISLEATNNRIHFTSKNHQIPQSQSKETSVRALGRVDTPRRIDSFRYDSLEETESNQYTIERRGSTGSEVIEGKARTGAAEGSKNSVDRHESGEDAFSQELDVEH